MNQDINYELELLKFSIRALSFDKELQAVIILGGGGSIYFGVIQTRGQSLKYLRKFFKIASTPMTLSSYCILPYVRHINV